MIDPTGTVVSTELGSRSYDSFKALYDQAMANAPTPTPVATTPTPKPSSTSTSTQQTAVSDISGMTLTAKTATSLSVSWTERSAGSHEYTVSYQPVGAKNFSTLSTTSTSKTISNLIPETQYLVKVGTTDGNTVSKTVTLPQAEKYRGYNYRWQQCKVYYVNEGDGFQEKRFPVETLEAGSIHSQLTSRDFYFYLRTSISRTDKSKVFYYVLAVRLPNGDTYSQNYRMGIHGSWPGFYCWMPIDDLFSQIYSDYGSYPTGTYTVNAYVAGQAAGNTSFKVE